MSAVDAQFLKVSTPSEGVALVTMSRYIPPSKILPRKHDAERMHLNYHLPNRPPVNAFNGQCVTL